MRRERAAEPDPDPFPAWHSVWSPDGRRIAFGSVVGGVGNNRDGEIFVVNVDGSDLLNLTRNPAMTTPRRGHRTGG